MNKHRNNTIMRWQSLLTSVAGLATGIALVSMLPGGLLFVDHTGHRGPADAASGGRYACPMMDFIGDKPGDCPVCGMKLQRVSAGEINAEQVHRLGLQTSMIATGPAKATVRAYGAVRYDDRTIKPVITRLAGRIVKRHDGVSHAGSMVDAGDPLVDIYSPDAFAAQAELAAAVKLGDTNAKQALVDRFARWNLAPVAAAILAGSVPIDTVTITSPYAGRVVMDKNEGGMGKLPEVGEEVMADRPLVRLVDPQSYMVVIHVPEIRAHWVRAGQSVHLASDDQGDLPDVQVEVSWVAPELNLEIRAREVHLHIVDPHHRLMPGSLVNARIEAVLDANLAVGDPASPATWGKFVLIPKTAVLSTGVRNVAWKVAGRQPDGRLRFELAPLALGPRVEDDTGNDHYVVRAGLKAGDEVATQGLFLIDSQAQLAGTASLLFPVGAAAPAPAHPH